MYFLYVLKSTVRHWRYIGITNSIPKRFKRHNDGKVPSTKSYRPFHLVHIEEFSSYPEARQREIYLKKNAAAKERLFKKLGI